MHEIPFYYRYTLIAEYIYIKPISKLLKINASFSPAISCFVIYFIKKIILYFPRWSIGIVVYTHAPGLAVYSWHDCINSYSGIMPATSLNFIHLSMPIPLHIMDYVNMVANISHHDGFFKKFMGDIHVARDYLQIHLPPHLQRQCNFDTLAITNSSFLEDNLRHYASDMLYSLQTSTGTGYIYCLIEHQSRPDKLMAFRLMRYSVAAMQHHLEQGHKQLPLVIPLLFYHGRKSPYPYSTRWLDCFADPDIARSVYTQAFSLVDVTVIPDETLFAHRRAALMEIVQKHIFVRDWMEKVCDIAALMQQWSISKAQFKSLVYYIDHAGTNSVNTDHFLTTLAHQAPHYKENIMTFLEKLERKGMKKGRRIGRREGRAEGREEGREEALIMVARGLLASGMERSIIAAATGLSDEFFKKPS